MYNAWLTGAAVVSRFQRPNLKNCLNCLPLPSGISVTRRPKRMWTCSGPFCRLRFRRSLGVSIRDSHRRPSSLTASWSASADQTHTAGLDTNKTRVRVIAASRSSTEVSTCQMRFRVLPVIEAARRWLRLTGKFQPTSCYCALVWDGTVYGRWRWCLLQGGPKKWAADSIILSNLNH